MSMGLHVILGDATGDGNSRLPRIGYDNVGVGATVTSDSTADGYDPANVFDWKPYTYWKPAASGTHYITVEPASTPTVDYFAMAQHTLGTNGGTVQLQYSTNGGGAWSDAFDPIAPTTLNEPVWRSFTAITAADWRVKVVSTPASVIGVVSFGAVYQPYYGVLQGFAPPKLARNAVVKSTASEAGLFLGRSILRRFLDTSITFNNMDPDDCYNYWLPFMKHAEQYPFFLAWLIEDYPTDIALMESDGQITAPTFMRHGAMTCGISMRGLCAS